MSSYNLTEVEKIALAQCSYARQMQYLSAKKKKIENDISKLQAEVAKLQTDYNINEVGCTKMQQDIIKSHDPSVDFTGKTIIVRTSPNGDVTLEW